MSQSTLTSPAARITFVMASMYSAWGMASPFFPRWLEAEKGLSGVEIGAVLSAAMLARIAAGPSIAAWADGFSDRRTPVRIIALAALAAWALLFFAADGFWPLFVIGYLAQTLGQALGPLIESAALRAGQDGRLPFGVQRAIGSGAFVAGNVGGGAAIAAFGLGATPLWVLAGLSLLALGAWFLLAHDPAPKVDPGFRRRLRAGLRFARTPRMAVLLIGCSCIQAGHAFYYAFSAIVWRGQGVSAGIVGALWGFAVCVEIIFLLMLRRIEQRVSPETLILVGAAGGIVRWSLLALTPPEWALWGLQALHALTFFPAHIGALRIIIRETPVEMSVFMQTIYAALQAGLFMGSATLASGWLYDQFGAGGYWLMSLLAAAGLGFVIRFRTMSVA